MLKLDAASITDCILNTLETLRLNHKSSLIGLGFDGTLVARGQLSGVQKHIGDNAPFAYYVHCYGHRLKQNIFLVLLNSSAIMKICIFT